MRAIEENVKPAVPESAKDTFRQGVLMRIGIALRKGERPLTHETDTGAGDRHRGVPVRPAQGHRPGHLVEDQPRQGAGQAPQRGARHPDRGARLQRALRTRPARVRRSRAEPVRPSVRGDFGACPGCRPARRAASPRAPAQEDHRAAQAGASARRTSSASGPEKKVRVPVKGTKRWQFILDRGRQQGVGQGDGKPGDVMGPGGNSSRPR